MTIEELQAVVGTKKKRKRTRSDKKYFVLFMSWCLVIQVITLYYAIKLNSEMLFSIFAAEAVLGPAYSYKQYLAYKKEINLKDMEMNYNPNYDELHGIR
jgi:hypothetical protein